MRLSKVLVCCLLLTAACSRPAAQAPETPSSILFEGATLITGDGSAPVENSAFLVENARIASVGHKGDIAALAGTARLDLTGKPSCPRWSIRTRTWAGRSSRPAA